MPRLIDVAAGRTTFHSYSFSAQVAAARMAAPKRAQSKFVIPKLTAAERREFLDAYGPVCRLRRPPRLPG
jgi:hypothetical protein